jgi:hypothetical protein
MTLDHTVATITLNAFVTFDTIFRSCPADVIARDVA